MTPNQDLFETLCNLRDMQAPIAPGTPRHPKHKGDYFRALAEAFEAGHLVPIVESVFHGDNPTT